MVHFISPLEVVNGMWAARGRGHGWVRRYLEGVGVARSTGYRWKRRMEWLWEHGEGELRRLGRERAVLAEVLARLHGCGPVPSVREPRGERAFVLQAAVLGTSNTEIAELLKRAGGRVLSHQTIAEIIAEGAAVARAAFERYFANRVRVGAADEIFLGHQALMLVVGSQSLVITGLRLAAGCGAEDWEPVFAALRKLQFCVSDAGGGVVGGAKKAGVRHGSDLFHGVREAEDRLARIEKSCGRELDAELEARQALEEALRTPSKCLQADAKRAYARARKAADAAVGEWDRLTDLVGEVRRAFDYTTPEGKLNTAERARAIVEKAIAAMEQTKEGQHLAKKVRYLLRHPMFEYLTVLGESLSGFRLEQVGPHREARLVRLVADTLHWRARDKDPVEALRVLSNGTQADLVEMAVVEAVDCAVRSSSAVECVNSRVRLVQVARKRMSEEFIYLLAVYHNMRTFGRGSLRQGKTAAELAGTVLPTQDWLELLELTALTHRYAGARAA
jgi:hypothetical protein